MMSGGDVRKVSRQDIQLVQNLIERCLQLYMSQKEVVDTLLQQAKIEPGFTELVWQKLEEENQEFFRAYHLRLIVKDQILRFNELLERQAEHMHLIHPPRITSISGSNGSQMTSMPQNSVSVSMHARPVVKEETLHQNVSGGLTTYNSNGNPTTYSNGNPNPPLQPPHMHTVMDMSSAHALSMNNTSNMLMPPHSSNVAMLQTMNGGGRMIKSEVNYPGNAPFVFGGPHGGSVLDTQHTIGDTNVSSFNEPSSIPLPDSILDSTETSFGLLGQIPRNFSLSDLSADFSNSNDILETYPRSPFMATDLDFIDPSGRR